MIEGEQTDRRQIDKGYRDIHGGDGHTGNAID